RPVAERAQLLADAGVGQDVDRGKPHVEGLKRGDGAGRETAHRLLRRPFHEQDRRVVGEGGGHLVAERGVHGGSRGAGRSAGVRVLRDSAWMGPPISAPKMSYTRRWRSIRPRPSKRSEITVA